MKGSYPVLTTDAFILHTRGIGEADRIITALTRDNGLMKIYARSIRKEGAKMRGSSIPYNRVMLSVIHGKRNILKDITVTDTFSGIWSNEKKYTAFVILLRRIPFLIPVTDIHESNIFSIIETTANFLDKTHPSLAAETLLVAQIMILTALGYIPEGHIPSTNFKKSVTHISSTPTLRNKLTKLLKNALEYQ